MGIWDKFFGKKTKDNSEKSPYLPDEEVPIDINFAKTFTQNGGHFLFCDSREEIPSNIEKIFKENKWNKNNVLSLEKKLAKQFNLTFIDQTSGNLKAYESVVMNCEFIISNTGKVLLSAHQIKHFNLPDLPKTIIILAKTSQIVKDVSQGMTSLKNKYKKAIPTNITSLRSKSESNEEKVISEFETSAKNIYLLIED
ncbi:LUD domain-containing protein [Flavobacteriaceae bacterium]|nr:LUD domain-containing protein [Flavobacteriaceae bacterium]